MSNNLMTFGDMDDLSSPEAVSDNNHTVQFDSSTHMSNILNGLNCLRNKSLLVDVVLNVGGQAFEAHRVVLSACSDYFCAMFTTEVRESREKEVTLEGISANGMNLILDYAYTSKLSLNLSNIQDVLSAASHVQVITVVEACSSYLQENLDLENCVDIVTLAETYSLHQLKKRVYRFISGHLMEFSQTPDFQRLSLAQLDYLLQCDNPVDCPESEVLQIVLCWLGFNNERFSSGPVILSRIHYEEIERDILKVIWDHSILACVSSQSHALYKAILLHIYPSPSITSSAAIIPKTPISSLVNSRGMELAIIKVGGFGINGITNEITYYLPSNKCWKYLTTIPHVEQCNFGTAVMDNHLYLIGGCFNQCLQENIHPFGFIFNPLIGKWTTMAPMKTERCRFTLNVVEDKLYAVGGASESVPNPEECPGERYEPETDSWHSIAPIPAPCRTQHAGASWKNLLFICGGLEQDVVSSSMMCYKTDLDLWESKAPMLMPRAGHEMVAYKDKLYICGGWFEDEAIGNRLLCGTIDEYDILRDRWTAITKIPTPRFHAGITIIQEKLYIIGGFHSDSTFDRTTGVIECFDLDKFIWSPVERYPKDVWEHVCSSLYIPKSREDMDVLPDCRKN